QEPIVTLEGVVALLLLLILSLAAVVYHLIRIQYSGAIDFSLDWNLFLSWIPLLVSYVARIHSRSVPSHYPVTIILRDICFLFFLCVDGFHSSLFSYLFSVTIFIRYIWLLLFPTDPYMITDLVPLSVGYQSYCTWHDAIMLYYYAKVSLIKGLISMYWIHHS